MKPLQYASRAASAAFALALSVTLSNCGNTGGGNIREKQSHFDGAKSISMSPAVMWTPSAKIGNIITLKIGANWDSRNASSVVLTLHHDGQYGTHSFLNIQGLDINVDGKRYYYNTRSLTDHDIGSYYATERKVDTSSRNTIVVPLNLVKKMVNANRCMLRARTSKGVAVMEFSKEKGSMGIAFAKVHMRQFLSKIETTN